MRKSLAKTARKMHAVTTETLAMQLSAILRSSPYSPKRLAHRLGVDPRAVKNWYSGENPPGAAHLINLMAECREIRAEIIRITKEINHGDFED